MTSVEFTLEPVPPFRLDLTVWALRRRPDNVVDRWDGRVYRRALAVGSEVVGIAVTQVGTVDAPELRVTATAGRSGSEGLRRAVTDSLERMLGLGVDLTEFYGLAGADQTLWALVEPLVGLKPPRFPTIFETIVNAISCQQITLTLCIRLLNRLAETYGSALEQREGPLHAFPGPGDLHALDPADLRQMQYSTQKARAVVELAREVAEGRLDLEGLGCLPGELIADRLRQLRGVGRWTAEYVLLRGFGRLHVFPGDDSGATGNLRRWLGISETLDYGSVRQVVEQFQPYAGLVYFHLLLSKIASLGYLSPRDWSA